MDTQTIHQYKKNITHLFIIASLVIAISLLAILLVLSADVVLSQQLPIITTVVLWIAVLFGSIVGESKNITLFNTTVSIVGFVCAFVLAMSVFVQNSSSPLSLFLFWISQILSAIFILSTYFSVQLYTEPKKIPEKKPAVRKRKSTK